jgi:hypothetical protein
MPKSTNATRSPLQLLACLPSNRRIDTNFRYGAGFASNAPLLVFKPGVAEPQSDFEALSSSSNGRP